MNRGGLVAQAFEPAGPGDFPVAGSWSTGLESPVNPAGWKACATSRFMGRAHAFLAGIAPLNRGLGAPISRSAHSGHVTPRRAGARRSAAWGRTACRFAV